jgi:two-component system CheB/CheR fusion protein
MARDSIAGQVRDAVKRAVQDDVPVQLDGLRVTGGSETRDFTLEVLPLHPNAASRVKYYLVLFVPTPAPGSEPHKIAAQAENEGDKDRLVGQLRHDLASSRLYLQSLLEERDAKNQELVSANEEIQSANEELQSTNEELETTKEELQSSNEELQTVNDELQNRNSVLTQASNDLSNLLNSVNLPVLMLSNSFTIRHFTPPAQRLMNLRAADIGRPFGEIRLNLNIDDLEPLFADVLDTLGARELEVQDREGHWYLLRVRPYRTAENKIDGLVVVLVDIDQLRRSQQELRDARDFARSIIEGISLPLVVIDPDCKIRYTNEAFCGLVGSSRQELEERLLPDLAAVEWGLDQPLRSHVALLRSGGAAVPNFEFEHAVHPGKSRVLSIRGRALQPDGERFLLVTFEDITPHKEVERLLKAEGERLASEVESATRELGRSQQELRALTGSLMTAQEDERRRVARELHDDISQRLASLDIETSQIEKDIGRGPAEALEKLRNLREAIAGLSGDVRMISHRLHPSALDDLGLVSAVEALVEDFGEREAMITTFSVNGDVSWLGREAAAVLFRIAQEALRNIAKHAGKTHVKVGMARAAGKLRLTVQDFGVGFDRSGRGPGLGLISMEERARLIGASFSVDSAPGRGTEVTVELPAPGDS